VLGYRNTLTHRAQVRELEREAVEVHAEVADRQKKKRKTAHPHKPRKFAGLKPLEDATASFQCRL
jgi:hypothetical protein